MVVVQNRVQVEEDHRERFERAFRERAGAVDETPGFLRNLVLRPTKEGDPYVVLTLWQDREAFEAWMGSPAFQHAHRGAGGAAGPHAASSVEVHEVVLDSQTE